MVPVNLNMLEGYVKKLGYQVRVFDASFYADILNIECYKKNVEVGSVFGVDYSPYGVSIKKRSVVNDFLEMVADFNPDLIGFGVYSYHEKIADKMSKAVKDKYPNIKIIWGGTHPTILPEETIKKQWLDIICIGEGEKALLTLCERLDANRPIDNIPNLWVKQNGKVIKNKVGPFIHPDELPAPDWESYAPYQQYGPIEGKIYKLAMVEFSRGCPFSCSYCESTTIKDIYRTAGIKGFCRNKSPEKFVADCELLVKKYGIEFFYFAQGTFLTMPDDVLQELAGLFRKRVNRPFLCLTTVPSITLKRTRLLREMGCRQVNMGIEAGNETYRRDVLNRPHMSNELIVKAFQLVKEAGIRVSSYNMVGLPWQSRKDVFDTIELNRMVKPNKINVSIFIPFKGTKLRERLVEEGYVDSQTILGDETQVTVNVPGGLTPEEIMGLYKTFQLYCRVPKKLFPLLKECEKNNEKSRFVLKHLRKIYINN